MGDGLDTTNVQGEEQKALDVIANETFVRATEWEGVLSGMASEEMVDPLPIPPEYPRGKYLLVFDPLDGSSNIEVNVTVGSIFSIVRAPNPGADPVEADFLQPGREQVAAGYAIYGPSTMLVLTVGDGVVGFTLEPQLGEFLLTHPDISVKETTAADVGAKRLNYEAWHFEWGANALGCVAPNCPAVTTGRPGNK